MILKIKSEWRAGPSPKTYYNIKQMTIEPLPHICVYIRDRELRMALKRLAQERQTSVSALVVEAIKAYLRRGSNEGGNYEQQ